MKSGYLVSVCTIALVLASSAVAAESGTPAAGKATSANAEAKPIYRVAPLYPAIAQSKNVEGSIRLCFTVNVNGHVKNVHVVKTKLYTTPGEQGVDSAAAVLEQAAINAIQKWRFDPKRVNGKPVSESGVCQSLNFKLE